MTRIAFVAAASLALSIACNGSGDGDERTPTASPDLSPSPSATTQDAREILRLSDDAMNRLTSVKEDITDGTDSVTVLHEAPDRMQRNYLASGWLWCVAGSRIWERQLADDGTWAPWALSEETTAGWPWPDFRRAMDRGWSDSEIELLGASEVEDFRIIEESEFAGEDVWVISYDYSYPTVEGPVPVAVTEWIAKETHWLLKSAHWQGDSFGSTGTTTSIFSGHNEPQEIECPPLGDDGAGA